MSKSRPKHDQEREDRIRMEIVVDAYGTDERAMSWYYYLERQLEFPFAATCIAQRPISPLTIKERVEVIGMPGEEECANEILVTIRWNKAGLAVPLSQLKPTSATGEQTKQAVEDWHYWVRMGYEF